MRKIELLAPARTADHGIEAVKHGADAVYIGAPQFSARAAAGNSIEEIERLARFAHQYYAKVYVALNTILTDQELEQAGHLIHQLYEAGTDALIVQDMGITQLALPPVPLHASTQMDNRTPEKVKFLAEAGFEQVVLARELSIEQIRQISQSTDVKLEAFIHGALCVSYSGVCYMSQNGCGRSANRGNCAQFCRLPYTLADASGRILAKEKHLLSLKDLNLSNHLKELLDAGISSLKIEGRLKDIPYVKNVTAYYRQALDMILEGKEYAPASSGHCTYTFTPNTDKSFHRGSTNYFLHGRQRDIIQPDTPKSIGEKIGTAHSQRGEIIVRTDKTLSNGDGFCFLDHNGEFHGFRANTVHGDVIVPAEKITLPPRTTLFRNFDQAFERLLAKESAERKIDVRITLTETEEGFEATATDEDGISATLPLHEGKTPCENEERQRDNLCNIFTKSGNTIFHVTNVELNCGIYFIPAGKITQWRRELLQKLETEREAKREKSRLIFPKTAHAFPLKELDYTGNVHNESARRFYQQHGVEKIAPSFESRPPQNVPVMTCKHCLRHTLGYCKKQDKAANDIQEPLTLIANNGKEYRLSFDCHKCEMSIIAQ